MWQQCRCFVCSPWQVKVCQSTGLQRFPLITSTPSRTSKRPGGRRCDSTILARLAMRRTCSHAPSHTRQCFPTRGSSRMETMTHWYRAIVALLLLAAATGLYADDGPDKDKDKDKDNAGVVVSKYVPDAFTSMVSQSPNEFAVRQSYRTGR